MKKELNILLNEFRPHIKNINNILQKTAKISKEILDIYTAIKEKDIISLLLGGTSIIGTVVGQVFNAGCDFDDVLDQLGVYQICPSIDGLVYDILRQSTSPKKIWHDNGSKEIESGIIEEFKLNNSKVYFTLSGRNRYPQGVYINDEKLFYKDISKIIEEKFGKFLMVENTTDFSGWGKKVELSSVPMSNDSYIKSNVFDEDEIVDSVNKFFKKNLNRSMLFFGPPGTGKSTLAVRIANRLDGKILIINGKSLSNKTSSLIFQVISIIDPVVILFDDLDRFKGINSLLGEVENMNKINSGRSKLIIATINDISMIPSAMRRPGRFDQTIEFLPPNEKIRLEVLLSYAKQFKTKLTKSQLVLLTKITEGMTQAYLKEVILRADVIGIDKIVEHIEQMKRIALFDDKNDYNNDYNDDDEGDYPI